MSARELLLEIGVEEIPARFLVEAETNLARMLAEKLNALALSHGAVEAYSTPRRLTVIARKIAERQEDRAVEKIGPAKKAAFDAEGRPTKAALGFAKGQGVDIADLTAVMTDKGEYIAVKKIIVGRAAAELLPETITELILALPWPKSMRWGDLDFRFARPIHWLVALFGGEVLRLDIGGVTSGERTRGHPFHAPAEFAVRDFADYQSKLRTTKVMLDPSERKAVIRQKLQGFAKELNGKWIADEALVEHVAYLVEWPVPLLGRFPERYLALPRELLVTPMREHQKYFSFEDAAGRLLPAFCVVANIESSDPRTIVAGNERVLVARLEDAKYYFETDRKKTLDDLAKRLDGVVFHEKLGTYADKTERVRHLVNFLCGQLCDKALDDIRRAVHIYKADLLTGVVSEFPELQGVMGMHYARLAGETETVARAIYEHYLPRFAGDDLPSTDVGAVLSVCDKMDSIVACFGVGLQPTGAGDPYALRRQALGVLHILAGRGWNVALSDLIRKALDAVEDRIVTDREALEEEIQAFFRDRLFFLAKGQGTPAEIADAVLAVRFDRVPETLARLKAVEAFALRPEFVEFAAAFKRAGNIVKDYPAPGPVDDALLAEEAERGLHAAVRSIQDRVAALVKAGDVLGALMTIAEIRPLVDRFFDEVLVMHKDEKIKTNRLNLVSEVIGLFAGIADFRLV